MVTLNPSFNRKATEAGKQAYHTLDGVVGVSTLFQKAFKRAAELGPKLKIIPENAFIHFHDRRHLDDITLTYGRPNAAVLNRVRVDANYCLHFSPAVKPTDWETTWDFDPATKNYTHKHHPLGPWADLYFKIGIKPSEHPLCYLDYRDPDITEKLAEIFVYIIGSKKMKSK